MTISAAADALRAGEISSVELVSEAIAVADSVDAELGVFLDRYVESSLAAAQAADQAMSAGADIGPLHGIPLGIKDIITTADGPTTAQSLVHDSMSGTGDAAVVSRLRAAGGIIMGKTTTMEFAIGTPDSSKPFPIPRNPWLTSHWAGGSSSGSGSGVATGAVLGALGTDTAGSIRIPAAFCGVTGLMPTFGRVPKSGCVPLGYSLDHIGPLARSARDCALMLGVLAGVDPSCTSSLDVPVADYIGSLSGDLTGLRIGVDRLSRFAGDAEVPELAQIFDAATATLADLGAELVELELPYYGELTAADVVILVCEALAYHLPDLQTRWEDYFIATRRTISSGLFYSGADYVQAQRARRVGQLALAQTFTDVDLIVTPLSSAGATSFEDIDALVDGAGSGGFGPIHAPYWDASGHPVMSVPIGFTTTGLPLALQIAGRPFDEACVLRAGDAYQQATDWHLRVPPVVETALSLPHRSADG
jgi:aspartyl-tRNA(Asn)/glutamyl-tRNA(Gln) amidotransferase subunit A